MVKVYLTKDFSFEAAHHLPNYEGKCRRNHGHSYKLQVQVSKSIIFPTNGLLKNEPAEKFMVMDFSELKRIVQEFIIDVFEHDDLNGYYDYPTAEFMAVDFYKRLEYHISECGAKLEYVKLWETENSCAEYRGE